MDLLADIIGIILQGIGIVIVGGVALFFIIILFGDEILWNFQANGDCEAFTKNKVKIKLKHTKKKGMFLEIRQHLKPEFQNKHITVLLNGALIATLDGNNFTKSAAPINIPIAIDKPKKGHIVALKFDDKPLILARLV